MAYIEDHILWEQKLAGVALVDGVVWLGRLSGEGSQRILDPHSRVLVRCYIDPAQLHAMAESDGVAASQLFANHLLPEKPSMRSGDSGEILARSALAEHNDRPRFPVFRWRNRSTRDDTVRGPDLLGYTYLDPDDPSDDDVLVICEVKTRASSVNDDIVREAYDDATKHYISDLKNALFFARRALHEQGDLEEEVRLARFSHPHDLPYKRRLVPCVVHNEQTWKDDFLDTLPDEHRLLDDVEVVVICVDNLAKWIDAVFDLAIAAADDLDALIAE